MQSHQERVVVEKKELDDKINKLTVFIGENWIFKTLPDDEQQRLILQHCVMSEYSDILDARIKAFVI
jgi:hypothetical protein